jgi:hypothetical protein
MLAIVECDEVENKRIESLSLSRLTYSLDNARRMDQVKPHMSTVCPAAQHV